MDILMKTSETDCWPLCFWPAAVALGLMTSSVGSDVILCLYTIVYLCWRSHVLFIEKLLSCLCSCCNLLTLHGVIINWLLCLVAVLQLHIQPSCGMSDCSKSIFLWMSHQFKQITSGIRHNISTRLPLTFEINNPICLFRWHQVRGQKAREAHCRKPPDTQVLFHRGKVNYFLLLFSLQQSVYHGISWSCML